MLKQRFQSQFAKSVLILLTGSLVAQMIPFLSLPILQKFFFSPADFGVLAVFISLSEIFTNISCLKMEFAIVPQKTDRKAINMAFGAIRISWFISLLSLLILLLFTDQIAGTFNEPKLKGFLFLIPIYVLIVGFNDTMAYWFNRKKLFSQISKSKIVQTSVAESIKLTTGYLSFNYIGLIWGRVSGFLASALFYLFRFVKEDRKSLKLISNRESWELIKKNKRFVFFTSPSVFLASLINLVYINLFLIYFGKEVVGIIGVSMTYISAGFGVISSSFSQVFYSEIAEIQDKDRMLQVYLSFAKKLVLMAAVPLLVIQLIPAAWVTYLLGKQWSELIHIARIMAVWLSVWFVASSLSFIYIRLGRQREMMLFDILHLVLIITGFYVGYFIDQSMMSALWGFAISQVIYYLFAIFIATYFIKKFSNE